MDKWKEIELEKMKVGGNGKAKAFFASQSDYDVDTMSLQQRYNSRAAALYREKIATEAQGKSWSIESSTAQSYATPSALINSNEKTSKVGEATTMMTVRSTAPPSRLPHPVGHSQRHRRVR